VLHGSFVRLWLLGHEKVDITRIYAQLGEHVVHRFGCMNISFESLNGQTR
jgi:hypothetical protein